jgi:acetyltransferase
VRTTSPASPTEAQNASRIVIRQLVQADRHALSFVLHHLGRRSRYLRYFGPNPNLPREVERLTSSDHWHHEVLIAYSPVPRRPIGVAEYVRLDEFNLAELAIVVADDWQRRGVGRALLEALRPRAMATGVSRLTMSMLSDNAAMLGLARELSPLTVVDSHDDELELVVDLR